MSIDVSQLRALSADLGRAAGNAVGEFDKVVERGALGVKNAMVAAAESGGHYKHFSGAISYDRAYRTGTIRYEVGPDKSRRQGALGNLLYFGSSKGGAVLDIEVGMRAEEGPLAENLADAAERLASGRG